jgi:hypothetical protein
MKKTLLILTLFLGQIMLHGQTDSSTVLPKRNTIYVEVLGQGILNSLSFDRLYRVDHRVKTSFTAGVMLDPTNSRMAIPISYNWLFGQKKSHLELGVGLTYWREVYLGGPDNYVYFTPKLGYRFQQPNGGVFFRVTFTPTVGLAQTLEYTWRNVFQSPFGERLFPWGGISLGYTLKQNGKKPK